MSCVTRDARDGQKEERYDVVIIGAGFTGLACGAGFTAAAKETGASGSFKIIDKGSNVGHFWTGGHKDLSLHSPYHSLPHDRGLAHEFSMFKSKHEVQVLRWNLEPI